MTAWTRTDEHGITGTFTPRTNDKGQIVLEPAEFEGLMRAGGWIECDCHEPGTTTSWSGGIPGGTWTCDNCGRKKKEKR